MRINSQSALARVVVTALVLSAVSGPAVFGQSEGVDSGKTATQGKHEDGQSGQSAQAPQPSQSGQSSQPGQTGQIDPQARKILKAVSAYYSTLKNFEVDINGKMTVESPKQRTEVPASYHIVIERPNRFIISLKSGRRGGAAACDGTKTEYYSALIDSYMVGPPVGDVLDLFGRPEFVIISRGWLSMALLETLLDKDPYDNFIAGVTKIACVGEETLDGVKCDHIHLEQPKFNCDFWIESGKTPLMHKVLPDLASVVPVGQDEAPSLLSSKIALSFEYQNFKADQKLKESEFTTVHPESAKKVDSFFDREKHPLEGQKAPDFTLGLIDGQKLQLSSLHDKVVVIDFWASWCAPCVRELPDLEEVSEQMHKKGVEFYAVNQRESTERVHKFLKDSGLNIPVALDSDGKVGELYAVKGIPQVVVIGKDGLVKSVHIGYSPLLKQVLTAELSGLLGGDTASHQ